ncbi:hypothetical protein, variant [Aphanomyces invadans]|uniref:Alpha/beta hydrolase fold-3 domain-containing protein n=1 Tax=Aphanomyces invadans TaxID=157072 RepID=A0A024TFA4_9STRA|nr:hypothetical protein H310_13538 [Aphanomyces invadans]XP_008879310.1 hypothetical protein, variant [Aphanomyces invadans]ETV92012.1 hypothetical protein H310_13538 [Aphanomyces invadans]ETV92013.1 hypothetical protein, variant [Aphanomyces invadans]|eukprot:XP_008879309.1 hypothetical protein H310_13538 [Aphanomyces invadans]
MAGAAADELTVRRPLSFARCLAKLLALAVTTPIRRLLGYKPPVDGWTIQHEIAVAFLRYSLVTDNASARRNESRLIYIANLQLKTQLVPMEAPGFRGVWYGGPTNDADATILYLHGGGYALCDSATYALANHAIQVTASTTSGKHVRVLGLEYSLAPEAKFPTQMNEALAAYSYLANDSNKPIVLMGDSAGGHLVLQLLLALKTPEWSHLRKPQASVAVSPWCQMNLSPLPISYTTNSATDYVQLINIRHYNNDLLPDNVSVTNPSLNPLNGDFRGTGPVLVHYGGKEVFASEIEQLVEVLQRQDVDVTVVKEPLAPHITPMLPSFFGAMAVKGQQTIGKYIGQHVNS